MLSSHICFLYLFPLILSFGVSSTAMALNINCIPNTLLTACSIFLPETAFQVQHIQSRTHHHNLMDFYVFRCQCLQEVLLLSPPTQSHYLWGFPISPQTSMNASAAVLPMLLFINKCVCGSFLPNSKFFENRSCIL